MLSTSVPLLQRSIKQRGLFQHAASFLGQADNLLLSCRNNLYTFSKHHHTSRLVCGIWGCALKVM